MFDYVTRILKSQIPPHPVDKQKEVDAVLKILSDGQGYLTKGNPKRIIFFEDIA
jgi:hypothetical protein